MVEGWHGDDYLILFNEEEVASASDRYAISQWLPGFSVIGLRGWDDFILRDSAGRTYSVPTVPAALQYLSAFTLPKVTSNMNPDSRFRGTIKWYVTPVVFGGDPNSEENLIWVSHAEHAELIKFWNRKYHSLNS